MAILRFQDKGEFERWLPQGVRYRVIDAGDVIFNFNPLRKKMEIEKTKVGKDALCVEIEHRGFNADMLERKGEVYYGVLFVSIDSRIVMLGVFAEYPKGLLWWPVGRRI
jgi:hypothetical protein